MLPGLTEIPDVIHATVTVLVKVTERNITADMRNASSQAYKNFSDLFVSQMNKVYKGDDLPLYKEVIIRELLNGSIVVDNGVVLEAKYTPEYKTVFRNATEIVKDKIMNETSTIATDLYQCRYHILCYNGNFTTVDEDSLTFSFDPAEYCFQNAAKDFGHYFYPEDLDGTLTCVNNCTQGTKSQVNCSPGYCQLLHSGPQCVCPNTDTHWYWGKTCESRTSKRLVYGLVGTVLALLLVLVITLAVILSCSQRRKHRSTYDLSQAQQREALPGTFQSTGVWEADSLKKEMYGLEKGYSHFQPNLENVDLKPRCSSSEFFPPWD
ncbi:mucin-12-like isoform X2 [Mus musculus]|uniref:mucin-12-like isoform X2 n=1 Tax=Mus musculus TaxID=10090 RepID=UPI0005ABB10E|nr:mucin-12-like isoform X2 [Mus musculus]|eukprot:XP_011239224.1 PREDICTED: mucin-12-like isoform X4 [Mus musculus]